MDYHQTLDYLYGQLPMYQRIGSAAYKKDLSRTEELDKYFGHPHRRFKSVHIAGTNGKGSVAHSLASILQQAGYKVGLYTSPHYLDFRERIRINGQMIHRDYVVSFVEENKAFFDRVRPSFFEMTVAMAFQYFADQNIDIAIVEVGMGGRLDSTNIITPLVSVITNIGYDHMQFLGNTLTDIAREKAGIIKQYVPVVIGHMPAGVQNVFLEIAAQKDAPIYLAANNYAVENTYMTSDGKLAFSVYHRGEIFYKNMKFGLLGQYQKKNIPVILQSIDVLRQYPYFTIDDVALFGGMEHVVENTGIMGRWQIISNNPLIVCDAGHNKDGISEVVSQIKLQRYKRLHMIFGTVSDKDINPILRLLPREAKYYFVRSSVERSMPADKLKSAAADIGLGGKAFDTVAEAIEQAMRESSQHDMIFIGGSTFVVADALKYFQDKGI